MPGSEQAEEASRTPKQRFDEFLPPPRPISKMSELANDPNLLPRDDDPEEDAEHSPLAMFSPTTTPGRKVALPVLVECRGDRLILRPGGEEILLPASLADPDTKTPVPRDVLQRLSSHVVDQLLGRERPARRVYWQPVLTFLVRPDGLPTYYRVRASLARTPLLIDHRLLDDSTPLEFPPW